MSGESALELEVLAQADGAKGIASVRAAGEIDLASADSFAASFASERVGQAEGVVVDLRAVSFMDSSGLRVLLSAARDVHGGFAVIVDRGSPVERLLEIAQVMEHLSVFHDEGEAIAAAAGASG